MRTSQSEVKLIKCAFLLMTDSCRYTKGVWSECDAKTNTRSRTLTLKKGEGSCVQTRTIQKKCKKGKSEKGKKRN